MIAQILLQLTSAAASVDRVKTSSHIVSRRFNALALGAVAADFAVKYARSPRADYLVGLILFVVLTATNAADPWLQQDRREHVPAARRLFGRVPGLRRRLHRGTILSQRANRAADSAAIGGHRPWLPRRGVK